MAPNRSWCGSTPTSRCGGSRWTIASVAGGALGCVEMRWMRSSFLLAALAGVGAAPPPPVPAAEPAKAEPAKPKQTENEWVFSLLPKSLQLRPRAEFNFLSNLTPAGKTRPVPTPEQPAYYLIEPGVNRDTGVGAEHGLKTPPVAKRQQLLEQALAANSFRRADESHPPTLVILFHWGSSSYQPGEGESEMDRRRALMDRAMLIGGEKFAKEIAAVFEELDRIALLPPEFQVMVPNPIEKLINRSREMGRLVEEVFSSSYYVVASAFDHAEMAKGRGVVLWRTKMTVNSIGVNMLETVPPMIASSAPFLGTDMTEPVVRATRIERGGRVEIGTPTVVEEGKSAPVRK